MCYTAEDSLNAYIINLVSSILLFINAKNNDIKIVSLFLLFVGQMQLFDYIFWKNTQCNETNKYITRVAIIFNHLQPVILYLLISYYGYEQNSLSKIIFISYIITVLVYTIKLWPNYDCVENTNVGVCCSLPTGSDPKVMYWKWNHLSGNMTVYILFLLYITVAWINLDNSKWFGLISLSTFLISMKIPPLNLSMGRLWCYIASLIPALMLFIN